MQISLKGKVALVTGGIGSIGTAICQGLNKAGAKVTTNFRDKSKADKWLKEQKALGLDVHIHKVDVTSFEDVQQWIATAEKELGAIDIVVNNAGMTKDATLRKMSKDDWDLVLGANLDSVFNVCRNVISGMTERGFGRVVNISSINGQKGQIGQTNYSASKAGMHGFTMALAQEVARKGVTVNTVSPGYIETPMVMAVPEKIREQIIGTIPVNRFGTTEEIAAMVLFLCSQYAGYITGADFAVNGGQHMM